MIGRAPLVPLLLLAAAGCTTAKVTAPSLLPRAIETRSDAEPVRPVATATPDPALDSELAALLKRRDQAVADYAAADRTAAARLVAGAKAPVGSDAWLDAQTALAALDTPRADLLAVLTELEQLAIGRAADGQPPYPALEAARADTAAALDRVTALLTERKARLPLQ